MQFPTHVWTDDDERKGTTKIKVILGQYKPRNHLKGTSRGLKAWQSYMNDSYHKSVLYWPEPTILSFSVPERVSDQFLPGILNMAAIKLKKAVDHW